MIVPIEVENAEGYVALTKKLESESDFLLYEEGERPVDGEKMKSMIRAFHHQPNSTILVAIHNGELVGHVMGMGGSAKRNKHVAHVVTGVLKEYHGRGIATELFTHLENWAREHEIHRLELTVMVHNFVALRLYEKVGFQIEGKKKEVLKVDGQWVDEYIMAKLLY
ncbi:GNAT family N-acetyltransferase [Halobacillus yeomjeoni]|uniref:GNAT family N-acetyltransferase n=1 Tax=Halobacillus yeomjeoni TaxID=311194 RepID=UPI001CD6F4B4|nr:GNAT family N-acetyltransferase [Halobacillus yeomjeoni]MCA0983946.1 GNAT family N-acetyltransferase [Halobacillus yeomjeoni]